MKTREKKERRRRRREGELESDKAWFHCDGGGRCINPSVATYPSAGGRRVTRVMRVPRKEYARSRHQRLFEENVGKTEKDAIYELLSERFGSCIYARGMY